MSSPSSESMLQCSHSLLESFVRYLGPLPIMGRIRITEVWPSHLHFQRVARVVVTGFVELHRYIHLCRYISLHFSHVAYLLSLPNLLLSRQNIPDSLTLLPSSKISLKLDSYLRYYLTHVSCFSRCKLKSYLFSDLHYFSIERKQCCIFRMLRKAS